MTQATAEAPQAKPEKRHGNLPLNMVTNYTFFQIDSAFRLQSADYQKQAQEEVKAIFSNLPDTLWVRYYSTFGLREDSDFFLWSVDKNVEPIHELMQALYKSKMGPYLKQSYNYLAVSTESDYVAIHEHQQVPANDDAPYLFVYPFTKTREWYLETMERRMTMMKEHIDVGHSFPKVTINTSYSFGIDDQDFVVSFDGHSLEEFVQLVKRLRETEASRYTHNDKPMFVGLKKQNITEVLESLGL